MQVLIVSENFFPKINPRSFRTFELSKELAREGHSVTVLLYTKELKDYDYRSIEEEFGLKVQVVPLMYRVIRGRITKRVLSLFLAWPFIKIYQMTPKVMKSLGKFDMIISIATPHPIHWGISRLGKSIKSKCDVWVADCGDPFMGCKTDTYRPPFYFKYIEKQWCSLCDFITIPIETAREGYYPEFHNKIRIIPQGFDFGDRKQTIEPPHNKVPTFIFAGSLIPSVRDPRPFLDFVAYLSTEFKLIIYTSNEGLIQGYKDILGPKLEIHPFIPRDALLEKMRGADFLLNIENGNTKVQVPSKLIDYALSHRPVLSINSFSLDKDNILRFLAGDYSGKMQLPDLSQYDIRVVAKQFIELYKEKTSK